MKWNRLESAWIQLWKWITINEHYTGSQNQGSWSISCYKTVSSYSEADAFCSHKALLTERNNRVCWDQKYVRQITKFKKKKNTIFPENLWINTGITIQTVQRSKMIKPHMTRFPGGTSHQVTMLKNHRKSQSTFHSGTRWQWKQIYSMTDSLYYLQINIINAHNKTNNDCYKI
jgi:hypothetical protein